MAETFTIAKNESEGMIFLAMLVPDVPVEKDFGNVEFLRLALQSMLILLKGRFMPEEKSWICDLV